MNCRNCGAELTSPQAMVCIKCGVPPLAAKNYCQNCGAETTVIFRPIMGHEFW